VSFHNGKTIAIPKEKAMWIPRDLYERTVFEIGLPKNVRQEFATQDFFPNYLGCRDSMSGSLSVSDPPFFLHGRCRSPVAWGSSQCRGGGGGYSPMARSQSASAFGGRSHPATDGGLRRSETDEMIPGTDMTKSELNRKVMAQIMRIKMADGQAGGDDDRLLKKGATADAGVCKKSVTFDVEDAERGEFSDSGHGSQFDVMLSDVEDDQRPDDLDGDATRPGLQRRRRSPTRPRTASPQRRSWRYWNSDPAPSVLEPKHYGPYREGPYRDCLDNVSILLRQAKKSDYNTGNSSIFNL